MNPKYNARIIGPIQRYWFEFGERYDGDDQCDRFMGRKAEVSNWGTDRWQIDSVEGLTIDYEFEDFWAPATSIRLIHYIDLNKLLSKRGCWFLQKRPSEKIRNYLGIWT